MAPKEIPESLVIAYRDADVRSRGLEADATKRVQDAMSATPGWQAASKAAAAHAVLVACRSETEALVSDLFRAHMDAGERNPETVASQVRARLLAGLSVPGLGFFEGSAAVAAALKPAELRHAAEFESWRDALAAGIADRFRRALEEREAKTLSAGSPGPRRSWVENPIVIGFLFVTATMSVFGVSWLGLVQKALAFL
jgi:hypothetical protein